MQRTTLLLCSLLLAPAGMAAEDCKFNLQNDFRVSSESLEVSSEGTHLYKIRQGGRLSVKDDDVDLNHEQLALAEEYAGDVGAMASQWIEFISRTLGTVGESLPSAFGEAFGEDSAAAVQSRLALARAKAKFDHMSTEDGVYTVSAAQFNDLGETLREEIELGVKASLGTLFMEIGGNLLSGEGSFEQRMEAFGRRMEIMGRELGTMGESLEEAGATICSGLEELQKLEYKLVKEIPEVAPYPLFGA